MTTTDSSDSTVEQGRQAAADVAQQAKATGGNVAGAAKQEARSVANDAKDQAADLLGTARSELRTQAAGQAKTLSTTLSDFGRQLGDLADGNGDSDTQVATLARSAADTLAQRAERIDEGGLDGVIADVKRFARNRPGAFLAGAIATGFVIGRLVKHTDLREVAEHAKNEIDTDNLKPELGAGSEDSDDENSPAGLPRPLAGGVIS